MLDWSRFEVLSFDCYGTLIDWESGILAALQPLLRRHGVRLADESLLELYGQLESAAQAAGYRPYREILQSVVAGLGRRLDFEPSVRERACLAESIGEWLPFEDTVAALTTLAGRYDLAVVSNIDDELFEATRRRLPVSFREVVTAQQIGAYKPSPRMFAAALERLDVPREQLLHVAQSLFHDIAPAGALGLATVWVNRRGTRRRSGATPPAEATPDLEVPDLRTLASRVG